MLKIDFYLMSEESETARLTFACRLIEKAYKHNHRIYVYVSDQKRAHALDELLWTYREESFLPHNLYGEGPDQAPPIQIGCEASPKNQRDILMNLGKDIPASYTQFLRILEVVSNDTDAKTIARDHYRIYRDKGYHITTHKLSATVEV